MNKVDNIGKVIQALVWIRALATVLKRINPSCGKKCITDVLSVTNNAQSGEYSKKTFKQPNFKVIPTPGQNRYSYKSANEYYAAEVEAVEITVEDLRMLDHFIQVAASSKVEDAATKNAVQDLFKQVAGEDMEIGWAKLKRVLDEYLKKEFEFDGLSREVCRSMVAMVDTDRTGKLGLDEFTELWTSILRWKGVFKLYDEDNSGTLDSFELRKALNSAGCMVNNRVLEAMVLRYGDDHKHISFEDFIMCSVKLKAMIGAFRQKDPKGRNEANFTLAEWVEKTIYA